jgi:hypothetical protein
VTRHRKLVRSNTLLLAGLSLFVIPILAQQSPSPKVSSTKQAAHQTSILLVDTDDSCRLLIDDEDKGVLSPDHSQKFNVAIGNHLLKCTVEAVPDLIWRKVVEVKDTSQVVVVVALKALHLQYDQAITKARSLKEEANVAATKQLEEAEAAEKVRKEEKDAFPQRMFDQVKGHWSCTFSMQISTFYGSLDFVSIEDGLIVGNYSYTASAPLTETVGAKWTFLFKPEPGRLVGTGMTHCEMIKGVKSLIKPGARKDKYGYAECSVKDSPNTITIIVNEGAIQFDSYTYKR